MSESARSAGVDKIQGLRHGVESFVAVMARRGVACRDGRRTARACRRHTRRQFFAPEGDLDVPSGFAKNGDAIVSFLQSQTSPVLAALAVALNWQGDASIILARNPLDIVKLACQQAGNNGMLLGWIEESEPVCSQWLRLVPCALPSAGVASAESFEEMVLGHILVLPGL